MAFLGSSWWSRDGILVGKWVRQVLECKWVAVYLGQRLRLPLCAQIWRRRREGTIGSLWVDRARRCTRWSHIRVRGLCLGFGPGYTPKLSRTTTTTTERPNRLRTAESPARQSGCSGASCRLRRRNELRINIAFGSGFGRTARLGMTRVSWICNRLHGDRRRRRKEGMRVHWWRAKT